MFKYYICLGIVLTVTSGASLYSSGQEAYSIAYVSVNQRLRNVAGIFSVAYELVDNWYQSIIGTSGNWFPTLPHF